jgi:hypothetical protein
MEHFCHIAFFEVFVRRKRTHVLGGVLFGLERMRDEGGGCLHGLRRGRMGVLHAVVTMPTILQTKD